MKDIFILLAHLLTTVAKLLGPGGAKTIIAENLLLKQQLLIVARSRRRAPNLSNTDRFLMDFWSLFLLPGRIAKVAAAIRPSTLLRFHQHLVQRKLEAFHEYYNHGRFHASLDGDTPAQIGGEPKTRNADLECYRWQTHCGGLVQFPIAA